MIVATPHLSAHTTKDPSIYDHCNGPADMTMLKRDNSCHNTLLGERQALFQSNMSSFGKYFALNNVGHKEFGLSSKCQACCQHHHVKTVYIPETHTPLTFKNTHFLQIIHCILWLYSPPPKCDVAPIFPLHIYKNFEDIHIMCWYCLYNRFEKYLLPYYR